MRQATCSVPECSAPTKRRGYCYSHYMRAWRYGTPTPDFPPKWEDIRGERFGSLVVLDRDGVYWVCRCDCGGTTKVRAGDLNRGSVTTCGDSATHHRIPVVGYSGAHCRVRRDLGAAADHSCVDCGKQAKHWSYDHKDAAELYDVVTGGYVVAYSLDAEHYEPRCVPCHKRYDLDRINATPARALD